MVNSLYYFVSCIARPMTGLSRSKEVALVPMRVQPLHFGHINLLLNISHQYARTIVLLSVKEDQQNNPFSFSLRKKWIQTSQKEYDFSVEIEALPKFSSPIGSSKSPKDIETTRSSFSRLGGESFSIITGNKQVAKVAREVYGFDTLIIDDTIHFDRLLPVTNPFVQYEDNGGGIRCIMMKGQFSLLSCCVPDFVIKDCHDLVLQKSK